MNICLYGEDLSRWRNETEFEICAQEHAIVRECRLVDQSSVVLLTSSGYLHWVR